MDWKTKLCVGFNLLLMLGICLVGIPLSLLIVAVYGVCCGVWKKVGQRLSIQQLSPDGAESHKEVTFMAQSQPIQEEEAPGAPPGPPEDQPAFAAWWADLEEAAKKHGATFSMQQALALYTLSTRTPTPVKLGVEESEAGE